jgi:adenylate cyclase
MSLIIGSNGDFMKSKFEQFKINNNNLAQKLSLVASVLDNYWDYGSLNSLICETWQSITQKTGELFDADRTTIFLLDDEQNEFWAIVGKDEQGCNVELRFSVTAGIAGEAATLKTVVNIPYDFYDDPRSANVKKTDEKTGYRTYTMLAIPLIDETGNLRAVIQLINKLKRDDRAIDIDIPPEPEPALSEKIDLAGFTSQDEQAFQELSPSILAVLETLKPFYAATQKQRAATALMNAVNALFQSSLDLDDTLKLVMDQAQKLMQADRSTLWLIDEDRNELWTKIPIAGSLREIRIPRVGFAGMVAQSGEPLLIPFDLYDDPRAETSKKVDQQSGYRTCSMLCMPVFNTDRKLIGVTQLVNKNKQGDFPPYNPEDWPQAPEQWRASFNSNDMEFMKAFNIQAAVALQNAMLFAEVKQQEQKQKDLVRSLPHAVISTDNRGNIITANDRAMQLLGAIEIGEGVSVRDLIKLERDNFSQWLDVALSPQSDEDREQYYPDRVLCSLQGEPQKIDLWINSITDASDRNQINGVLVILSIDRHQKGL